MADVISKSKRSAVMRAIKSKDTRFEIEFRSELWKRGLRYRVKYSLPGKPDLVFVESKVLVFLDSCFWHGCRWHCRMPKSNVNYWDEKIRSNRCRDESVTVECRRLGWTVLRFWEHSIRRDLSGCLHKVIEAVHATRRAGMQS